MQVRWTIRALESLMESTDYIRSENPEKARRVVTEIKKTVSNLQSFPHIGISTSFPNTRDLVHPTYDFLIRYRINKESIEILFVWHAAQNLKYN